MQHFNHVTLSIEKRQTVYMYVVVTSTSCISAEQPTCKALRNTVAMCHHPVSNSMRTPSPSPLSTLNFIMYYLITGTVAVAVDEKRTNLMEFGRYVQEMLPKFVQHAQITHG